MRRTFSMIAAAAVIASLATAASAAPTLDAKGKCRDGGKFVAASMCKAAAPAGGKCRDPKSHFAKCGTPGAKPAK
jgi:hypothetical protein